MDNGAAKSRAHLSELYIAWKMVCLLEGIS